MSFKKFLISKSARGFTLAELLVVAAVIGVLALIIVSRVDVAKTKSVDASIKAAMVNAYSKAVLYYDQNNSYTNVCTDPSVLSLLNEAAKKLSPGNSVITENDFYTPSSSGDYGSAVCHNAKHSWAAIISLKNPKISATGGWCIDSKGTSKEANCLEADRTTCPKTQDTCEW